MDLHFQGPEATPDEKAAVDSVLGPPASSWSGGDRNLEGEGRCTLLGGHAARSQRDRLLPVLHAVQSRFGWVPPGALDYVCRRLTIPPAEAYGVVTFYHLFSTTPQPPTVAHVCDDIACRIRGSESICQQLQATMGPEGEPGWKRSPCRERRRRVRWSCVAFQSPFLTHHSLRGIAVATSRGGDGTGRAIPTDVLQISPGDGAGRRCPERPDQDP